MTLRVCPVDGCGATMRTSVTVLVVSRDGAEYKRVCQRCARKAQRLLPAAISRCCQTCGEKDPATCGRCVEARDRARNAHVGAELAKRIRAVAAGYRGGPEGRGGLSAAAEEFIRGMMRAAEMAEGLAHLTPDLNAK